MESMVNTDISVNPSEVNSLQLNNLEKQIFEILENRTGRKLKIENVNSIIKINEYSVI